MTIVCAAFAGGSGRFVWAAMRFLTVVWLPVFAIWRRTMP